MSVGTSQWRAGIAHLSPGFQLVTLPRVLLLDLFPYSYVPCGTIPSGVIPAK